MNTRVVKGYTTNFRAAECHSQEKFMAGRFQEGKGQFSSPFLKESNSYEGINRVRQTVPGFTNERD